MSDKRNINIQDRGWNDMRSVLDKEMPEKERKRRFGFWFYLGASVILIAFFIGVLNMPAISSKSKTAMLQNEAIQNSDNANAIKPESSESEAVESSKLSNLHEESLQKSNSLNNKEDVDQSLTEFNKKPIGNIGIPSNAKNTKKQLELNAILDNKTILEPSTEKSSLVPFAIRSEAQSDLQLEKEVDLNPEKHIEEDTKVNKEGDLDILMLKERSILNPIIRLPYISPKLDIPADKSIDLNNPIVAQNNQYRLIPYVVAAGNYQSNINGLGYGFGAGLSYGSNDFQIYVESGYYKSKFDSGALAENFAADQDITLFEVESQYHGVLAEGNSPSYDLRVNNFSQLTRSTSEIKIDLGIRKKIFKGFSLDVGLAYSKLLGASNKSLEIAYKDSSDFPEGTQGYTGVSSSELYNGGAYSSYDIVPHIGVEYSMLSNLHLGVNYNHGLINLISNTELDRISSISANETIYRRNISAKLRFEF